MPSQLPRKRMRRREVAGGARFVTFSCQRRLALLTNPRICELLLDGLKRARTDLGVEIFAWVFMPEHVHLLCRPHGAATLERALRSVKMSVARRVLAHWHSVDAPVLSRVADATGVARFWQKGGGFDRNVRDMTGFCKEVRYIHRNPVERGLVKRPEEWRWSSVRWWMGQREGEFPCDPPPGNPKSWERWKGFM